LLTGRKPDPAAAVHSRLVDELQGWYMEGFLRGIDATLELNHRERPQSVSEWRSTLGLGPDRSTADPHATQQGTPTSDSEATIVMPKPGPDRQEQADSPTVVLPPPPNPEATSRSSAVGSGRPDPAGDESRSKRLEWLRTHWLSALSVSRIFCRSLKRSSRNMRPVVVTLGDLSRFTDAQRENYKSRECSYSRRFT